MKRIQHLHTDIDQDFVLFGILALEKPHRMAWLLNNSLQVNLKREADIELHRLEQPVAFFARFDFGDELNRLSYTLLENKYEGHQLVNELKNIDFLLIIKGALEYFDESETISKIKLISEVQLVSSINISQLKSLSNLILPDTEAQKLLL